MSASGITSHCHLRCRFESTRRKSSETGLECAHLLASLTNGSPSKRVPQQQFGRVVLRNIRGDRTDVDDLAEIFHGYTSALSGPSLETSGSAVPAGLAFETCVALIESKLREVDARP
jgi:hypothetical protein